MRISDWSSDVCSSDLKPDVAKWSVEHIAAAWDALMLALGYDRYFAQGGDWGSAVTCAIGVAHGDHCAGIHVNMVVGAPPPELMADLTRSEERSVGKECGRTCRYRWSSYA